MKRIAQEFYLLPILGYALLFAAAYAACYWLGWIDVLPAAGRLAKWDAAFYDSIRTSGYIYEAGKTCNSGFFPLFPYFWKITTLGPVGISILNGIIYLVSLAFLARLLKPGAALLGLFMAFPFMFFMFTPLSESLFFLFGVIIIYGLVRHDNRLIFLGVLLASLTRASFLFFVPAFIGMSLMMQPKKDALSGRFWLDQFKWFLLPVAIAVVAIGTIQYLQVGRFFAYYEIQSTAWGRSFGLPVFPLGRNSEPWVMRLNWLNFWIGMFVSVLGLKYLIQWLFKDAIPKNLERHELFSLIFLVMSFLSIVFFNPEWYWTKWEYNGTYLAGINRYMEANPFFLVFLTFLFKHRPKKAWYLLVLFLGTHLVWFLVFPHYFGHIQRFLNISVVTLILLGFWLFHYFRWKPLAYILIPGGFILQSLMFYYFMTGVQVD